MKTRLKILAACAALVAAGAATADYAFQSPDGRRAILQQRGISVDGNVGGLLVASGAVTLFSASGASLGESRLYVSGCAPGHKALLWYGSDGNGPTPWKPGGSKLNDLLASAVCQLAIESAFASASAGRAAEEIDNKYRAALAGAELARQREAINADVSRILRGARQDSEAQARPVLPATVNLNVTTTDNSVPRQPPMNPYYPQTLVPRR